MLAVINSRQISEWMAYYSMEPWGEKPKWLRHGIRTALLANIHRGKNAQAFRPADFMPPEPGSKTEVEPQSVDEQTTILQQIAGIAKRVVGRGGP